MKTLLEMAMYWKKAGVATIPIRYMDKKPDGGLLPKDAQGDPTWEPYQKQLPTDVELRRWFPSSLHNIGIVTGWQNLLVIDFDDPGSYFRWTLWATRMGGFTRRAVELTYMVKTARGVHAYFRTAQPEQNRKLEGIDIKARGGYVLGELSTHPTGAAYAAMQPGVPIFIEALSDVLPAQFLIEKAQVPFAVKRVVHIKSTVFCDDPWEQALHSPDPKQDLIDQIRATFRIESFFPDADFTSSDHRWMMAPCPFHEDKHPSFWIDTARQICNCYGCGMKAMDVINLYARLHGLTNRDAIFYMAHHL